MTQSAAARQPPGAASAWTPMRHANFRRLWIAQFAANVGNWAQTVGAQWLVGDLGGGAFEVAVVQTAVTLPVFLLVVPAGAVGDIADRRRLLLISNAVQMAAAVMLAVLTVSGAVTIGGVFAIVALIATAAAFAIPTASAVQPELVPREAIGEAALLNGANLNVARAVGPAVGGLLISLAGPEAAFALNAVSFVGVLYALFVWQRAPEHRPLGPEHLGSAIVTGWRYVRSAPSFARLLARTLLFSAFASSLWALLPVFARGPLGLGAGGYGMLLGSVGLGAVVAAFAIPPFRQRFKANATIGAGSAVAGVALLVLTATDSLRVVIAALALFGLGWIAVTSSLNGCAQIELPHWIGARGLAFFTLTFFGGQAVGSVAWGAVAEATSLDAAFDVSGAGLLIGAVAGVMFALHPVGDVRLSRHWPEPHIALEPHPEAGPVLITVEWRVNPEFTEEFLEIMREGERARKRTGATLWGLFQDADEPHLYVETFTVSTWHEHLRQHIERPTLTEEALEERARRYLVEGEEPRARHLIWAYRPTV